MNTDINNATTWVKSHTGKAKESAWSELKRKHGQPNFMIGIGHVDGLIKELEDHICNWIALGERWEKLQSEMEKEIEGLSENLHISNEAACYLEKENKKLANTLSSYDMLKEKSDLVQCLRAENKKLRECVGFYADKDNWMKVDEVSVTEIAEDQDMNDYGFGHGGERARQCLKEIEK